MKTVLAICVVLSLHPLLRAEEAVGAVFKGAVLKEKLAAIQKDHPKLELKTADGEVIKWAEITALDPQGLKIMNSSGVKKFPFSALGDECRNAFGYDATAAESFANQDDAQARQAALLMEELKKKEFNKERLGALNEELRNLLTAERRFAVIRVYQVNKEGMIGYPQYVQAQFTPSFSTLGTYRGDQQTGWELEKEEEANPIWVYGDFKVADGERYNVRLYPVGRKTEAWGQTMRAFTTSVEEAVAFLTKPKKEPAPTRTAKRYYPEKKQAATPP